MLPGTRTERFCAGQYARAERDAMLPQQKKGWTTVVDIEQFKKMTWTYLTNVKQVWQYQGMAYLFREAGIDIYGKDLGTLKMNHPIACMAIPQHKDKNYGVDIYVPAKLKAKAEKLIADEERLRKASELEMQQGEAAHEEFERAALAAKARNAAAAKARRAEKRARFLGKLMPRTSGASNGN